MKIVNPYYRLVVFAGPNGSGKSTITKTFFKRNLLPETYINPDDIAKEINPNDVWGERITAGKKAVELRDSCLKSRKSFSMETTLSGFSEITAINKAIEFGYKVTVVYIAIDGEYENVGRVKNRVNKGGHNIKTVDILRRRRRSFKNLSKIIDIVHRMIIIDNTQQPKTILKKNNNKITFVSSVLPEWFSSSFSSKKINGYRLEAYSRRNCENDQNNEVSILKPQKSTRR